jgi:hypothetical protein
VKRELNKVCGKEQTRWKSASREVRTRGNRGGGGGKEGKRREEEVEERKEEEEKKKEEEGGEEERREDGWKEDEQDWKAVCTSIVSASFDSAWKEIQERETKRRENAEREGSFASVAEKKKHLENLNSFLGSKAQGTVKPNFLADVLLGSSE